MDHDTGKVEEVVLGLLYLNLVTTGRPWKGLDWDALDRLHVRGLISNPKSKARSVDVTEAGCGAARRRFSGISDPLGDRASEHLMVADEIDLRAFRPEPAPPPAEAIQW